MENEKVVLIAVVGMSPAVVTESIWGLYMEQPELVPDEVKVCTTRKAWDNLCATLLGKEKTAGVWAELEENLGKKIRLTKHIFEDGLGGELADIVSSEDQNLVADQLLQQIRSYKNPQQEVCRLVASIAGGRKSMSALMYAAMSLGAEPGDIITHVLADEMASACPEFFFPKQKKQKLTNRNGEKFSAAKVRVDLAEIPFVPLASLVKGSDFETSGSFSRLAERAQQHLEQLHPEDVKIRVSTEECKVYINGRPLMLKAREYMLMAIMTWHSITYRNLDAPQLTPEKAYAHILALKEKKWLPNEVLRRIDKKELFFQEEEWKENFSTGFNKERSYLKKTLEDNGFSVVARDALKPRVPIGFERIQNTRFRK